MAACLGVMVGCGDGSVNGGNGTGNGEAGGENGGDQEPTVQETTLERAQREGYVTVGFANEAPYAYATPDGTITGEAVEIARVILQNLGIEEMNGIVTEFGSMIAGLNANRFDIITAGMFINEERAQQVAFANPEYSIGAALGVEAGNPYGLHSYQDIIDNPDVTVAVMVGAAEHGYMQELGVPDSQILTVPDQPSAISALQAGRAQAVTMTGPALQAALGSANDDNLERVENFEQPIINGESVRGYGAAAFRHEDDDFREAFNEELEKLKESGQLLEILEEFGFTEDELPGDVTVEDLVGG
ncbi:ectoine/hydroxyectoine ABC transporter substrate-binding protein EhuB [Paenibacillus senegalensis]|uniref:ectoine/hydroxyectoine ABC transporter substrate-binding protein EhuB n=1 Tax=Paenibacillus senegalensis TaxID=1465766 RepID=UPI000289CEAE|nr:ectoine/hydroxyectoine ABC transporter substrate-binding protein EhuB [Paenibacillus senegalensis]